jgi:3-hydroxyacyl-CoA dehydrogenase
MNPASPPILRVAVVGAGLVGSSWAVVFARAGLNVNLYDADPAQRQRSLAQIERALGELASASLLRGTVAESLAQVHVCESLAAAVAGADYVQESIAESLPAKRELFAVLDAATDRQTILASSTSAFATSEIADSLPGRDRMVVAHPVNPPHLVPFVEISGAPFTRPDVVLRTRAFMAAVGQSPIEIRREIHGFVLNRLQWTLMAEAYRLVRDGVASADDVDRAIRDGLGRRWAFMGPFETGDLNAPQGIADYFARFGPTFERIDAERRGDPLALDSEVIARIHADCRERWSESQRAARLETRDQRLLALAAHLSPQAPDPSADSDYHW